MSDDTSVQAPGDASSSPQKKRAILYVLLLGMLATGFPFTILTVALKLVAEDLGVTEALATWTISAPMLISATCMPFLGKLGDLYGHRRIFLLGIAGSTIFALLCFIAWDIWSLIFFRVLSMSFAGATTPAAMALLFHTFIGQERTKAISWWAMGGPASAALGLIAGGPMVDFFGWRSVFLIQVVAGALAFVLALTFLPETPKRKAQFDHHGNALLMISLTLLLFAIGSAGEASVATSLKLGAILAAGLGLVWLARVEARASEPIIPPFLMRERNFLAPVATGFICQAAYLGSFVITPMLLVETFGLSISVAALFMLARTGSITIASPIGGRIAARIGERQGSIIGLVIQTAGLVLVAMGAWTVNLWVVGVGLVLQGAGHGLALPPLTSVISYAVPSSHFGTASGVSRLATQIGSSFGLSLFAAMIASGDGTANGGTSTLPQIFLFGAVLSAIAILPAMAISVKYRNFEVEQEEETEHQGR
jgi:MFS family permease